MDVSNNNEAPASNTGASPQKPTKGSDAIESQDRVSTQSSLDIALDYHRRGWAVLLPLPRGEKNPKRTRWQTERFESEEQVVAKFDGGDYNIGIRLGEASGGLIDVDIDDVGALRWADDILPPTDLIFGRAGKLRSHRLYRVTGSHKQAKLEDVNPDREGGLGTIIEFRSQSNQMTVFPGSVHGASGETIEWESYGEPAEVDADELKLAVHKVAAFRLLERYWPPEGVRHYSALALIGGLLRSDWKEGDVQALLERLWTSAEPGEIEAAIRTTQKQLSDRGGKATGWPKLREYINPAVVEQVCKWLGVNTKAAFPLSDFGNSERFIHQHGNRVLYCEKLGGWHVYDGKRWALDELGRINQLGKETIRSIPEEGKFMAPDDYSKLLTWVQASENGNRLELMLKRAQTAEGISVLSDEFDRDQLLLNLANGTYDFRTATFREHRPEDRITKVVPVAFDPEAKAPLWEALLQRAFSRRTDEGFVRQPELEDYFQRVVGHMLTGKANEKAMFVAYGPKDTGKTVITEILLALFGDDYSQTASQDAVMSKEGRSGNSYTGDLAAMRGKRLVIVSETSAGQQLNVGLVKAMTGRNPISARYLFKEQFTFVPEFKLLIETNNRPGIPETSDAIWERVKLIPFTNVVPKDEQDKDLPDKLRAELPGILNWALQGCAEWQKQGLNEPSVVTRATDEYRETEDRLSEFFEERLNFSDPKGRARKGDVYEDYSEFCQRRGQRALSSKNFTNQLKERGFEEVKSHGTMAWKGVKLQPRVNRPIDALIPVR